MAKGKKTGGRDFTGADDPRRHKGGLPPGYAEVRDAARTVSLEAVEVLKRCMHNEDDRIAMDAAKALLERAWGKPASAPEDLDVLKDSGPVAPRELVMQALVQLARQEP